MTNSPLPARDLRVSGSASGSDPTDPARWIAAFLALGVALRLLRFGLNHPLWRDEAYVGANLLGRDYEGLTHPLDFQQVCPVGFLWAEKAVCGAFGFSERSMRLIPTLAAIAGLFLFRHVAGRLLKGSSLAIAVGILAVGYTPIRHGGEVKPYATDFLAALLLLGPAVEWLRDSSRSRWLWGLAAVAPVLVAISNPSIFVAVGVGISLAAPVVRSRSTRSILALFAFGLATAATFLFLYRLVNAPQSASVMGWMRVYWAGAFPPRSLAGILAWLARVHTSQMFAYPAGGDAGASALTTGLVAAGILAVARRGSRTALGLLLAPFGLGLVAAFLGRYPYGGSARTMQYVAPAIIMLAGLGAAAVLARLPRLELRDRGPRAVLLALFAIGLGQMAWDVTHTYPTPLDAESRAFAARFWEEESRGAELLCARTDLRLDLDPLVWQGDRAAVYLCHRAIDSGRLADERPLRLDRVSDVHPLRVVVFNEAAHDSEAISRWIAGHSDRFALRARRERVLHPGLKRGKASLEERYVVYELVPSS